MHFDNFDDELWDEFKWEAHLNEVERKSEQLRKFIASDPKGNVPRWITLLNESLSEDDAYEAFIEEELLMDEAYFPEEEDWDDDDEDWDEDDFLFRDIEDLGGEEEEDDFDEGEEWKSLTNEFVDSEYAALENLPIYNNAKDLAVDILRWAELIPEKFQDSGFQDFVGDTLKIGAKIAGGFSFGYEHDYIGANIAYSKKALQIANRSLEKLQSLKRKKFFDREVYQDFHSRLFELRNDIGVHVQELRERFNLGLD
ncbi:hypothetical protein AB2B38_007625 [Balneola sp. MJW-20]|uniref:hypothetical protein n=1 Tax=Gracilimonas aurantiaca TaxID=3234185 RepID=UPI003467DF3B